MAMKHLFSHSSRGFTLFIAIIVMATLLLVSVGISAIVTRQAFITESNRESQYAFYAADTGVECALYWDVKNGTGYSAFSTSTGTSINCNKNTSNPTNAWTVGGASVSSFTMKFLPDSFCAIINVTKNPDGTTLIESHGYNTCSSTNPRRVERAIRVTY